MATPVGEFTAVNLRRTAQKTVTQLQQNLDDIQTQLTALRTALNTVISEVNGTPAVPTGVTAGTYASPISITVGTNGAITAITAGETPIFSSARGAANGVCDLDANGKVPNARLQAGIFEIQGNWNAATNTPTLASGVGTTGHAYFVSTAGTTNLDGTASWAAGDVAIFAGGRWEKLEGSLLPAGVTSVNGKTGVVIPEIADIAQFNLAGLNARITDGNLDLDNASRPPTGAATGDLGNTYPNPIVTGWRGRALDSTAPTDGQVMQYFNTTSDWRPTENLTRIAGMTGSIDAGGFQAELAAVSVPVMDTVSSAANAANALEAIDTIAEPAAVGAAITNARVTAYSAGVLPAAIYDSTATLTDTDVFLAPQTVITPEPYLVVVLPSSFTTNNFAVRILDSGGTEVTRERVTGIGTGELQFAAVAGSVTNGARGFYSTTMVSLIAGDQIQVVETAAGTRYELDRRVIIDRDSLPIFERFDLAGPVERAIFNTIDVTDEAQDFQSLLSTAFATTPATPELASNFRAFSLPVAAGVSGLPRSNLNDWSNFDSLAPIPGTRYYVQLNQNIFSARALFNDNTTVTATFIGRYRFGEDAVRTVQNVFRFDIPASPTSGQLGGLVQVQQFVTPLEQLEATYQFKVTPENLSAGLHALISHPPTSLDQEMAVFIRDLSRTTRTASWAARHSSPYSFTLSRVIAALWDENRHEFTGNYFDDILNTTVLIPSGAVAYYPVGSTNTVWPGQVSFSDESIATLRNTTTGGATPINPTNYNLVVGFRYRFEDGKYPQGSLLQFGSQRGVLEFDRDLGLVAVVGQQDAGAVSRTLTLDLEMVTPNLGTTSGQTSSEKARGIIPEFFFAFPLTVTVTIERFTGDVSNGTDSHTYVITAFGTDQLTPTAQTFTFGPNTLPVNFTYDAAVTGLKVDSVGVVDVQPQTAITDHLVHYKVSITAPQTRNWNPPSTYDTRSIDQGRFIDSHGNMDPSLYNTRTPKFTNDLLLVFSKFDETDMSADPELVVSIIVNGDFKNTIGDQYYRLFRRASDLGFTDGQINDLGILIGQIGTQVGDIQTYYWSGTQRPNHGEMLRMWQARTKPGWMGAFIPSNEHTDVWTLRGDMRLITPSNGTVDVGEKLSRETVQRVTLASSAAANTAGQNFGFATNPATSLPWNTIDFDEIQVEQTIGSIIHSERVRANVADGYEIGTSGTQVTIDLNATSIDFNTAGAGHNVIGVNYA